MVVFVHDIREIFLFQDVLFKLQSKLGFQLFRRHEIREVHTQAEDIFRGWLQRFVFHEPFLKLRPSIWCDGIQLFLQLFTLDHDFAGNQLFVHQAAKLRIDLTVLGIPEVSQIIAVEFPGDIVTSHGFPVDQTKNGVFQCSHMSGPP